MSTLAEVQKALPLFSADELAELELVIRKTRRKKEEIRQPSLGDIRPVSVGSILRPLGTRTEWYEEMLGDKT
jgi:hypothetical protein